MGLLKNLFKAKGHAPLTVNKLGPVTALIDTGDELTNSPYAPMSGTINVNTTVGIGTGQNKTGLVPIRPGPKKSDEETIGFKDYTQSPATKLEEKFGVTIGAKLIRRTFLFDTAECRSAYKVKGQSKEIWEVGRATFGVANGTELRPLSEKLLDATMIWVCVPWVGNLSNPAFFSHIGKVHHFHHSTFTGGGDVVGAGEWIVEKGRLILISGNSGHYRPPTAALQKCVQLLAPALTNETQVLLYHVHERQYVTVPALEFKRTGSKGGLYKVHPDSA